MNVQFVGTDIVFLFVVYECLFCMEVTFVAINVCCDQCLLRSMFVAINVCYVRIYVCCI